MADCMFLNMLDYARGVRIAVRIGLPSDGLQLTCTFFHYRTIKQYANVPYEILIVLTGYIYYCLLGCDTMQFGRGYRGSPYLSL